MSLFRWLKLFALANFPALRGGPPFEGKKLCIRKGTRFAVREPFTASALVHWNAPMTSDQQCFLSQGTVLVAMSDFPEEIRVFQCVPEDPDRFIAEQVPAEVQHSPKFAGVSFILEKSLVGPTLDVIIGSPS